MADLPALVNAAAVALLISVLVSLTIRLLVIILVAVRGDVSAVGVPVIIVMGRTVAVPGAPVSGAIVDSVLVAVLPRRTHAVTAAIPASTVTAITIAVMVPIAVAIPIIAVVAGAFTESALIA